MDVNQLQAAVQARRKRVVPFVGSGMALGAGAPGAEQLAEWLASHFALDVPNPSDLLKVTAAAVRERTLATVQVALAEYLAGYRMRSTPALTAMGACARRTVVTTNYDDAIEVAARARGVEAIPLLPTDPRVLQPPEHGTMHVIHAHGLLDRPETMILPGGQMTRLADDSPFLTFMRSTLASGHVLYLGFSLAAAEVHLRGIVQWLDASITGAPGHWLLLPAKEVVKRGDELDVVAVTELLSVVTFDSDRGYGPVEDVALELAPRLARAERDADEADRLTWVQPDLYEPTGSEDPEELARQLRSFEYGVGQEQSLTPEDVIERQRAVIVGGPGTGKTTLLRWLSHLTTRPVAYGSLRDFVPEKGSDPTRALLRRLTDADGAQLSPEQWQEAGLVIALDGLEEVDSDFRPAAMTALVAAAGAGRRVLVAARPTEQLAGLRSAGFDVLHLVPSYRWARKYLQTRSVPAHRVQRVLLRDHGLGELLTVPVYAGLLADALLDDSSGELSPLRLLVGSQERSIGEESIRAGEPAAALSRWTRDLALGLQLTGRTSVALSALTEAGDDEQHRRLVAASVLGDVADRAAFTRRTAQEALVADEILASGDRLTAFRAAAVATVDGHDYIRADFDLVADLVFEHAPAEDRAALRTLDGFRWARTALGSDDPAQAEQALDLLERWHAERDVDWVQMFRRDGLRTAAGAVSSLLARWPALGATRRERWRHALREGSTAARRRAVTALAALRETPHDWVFAALADPDSVVQARAAEAAGRLCIEPAVPRLLELLESREEMPRRTALQILVELLPVDELDQVGTAVGSDPLHAVHERLEERISLDAGLRLLAAAQSFSPTHAWLLDRLVARAPAVAWTPARVAALMYACGSAGAVADVDTAALAAIVERHPEAALRAVWLHYLGPPSPRWRGAPLQMCVLALLPPERLTLHEHPERLAAAVLGGLEEIEEIEGRRTSHERAQRTFEDAIDADPDAIGLSELLGHGVPLRLDEQRLQALRESLLQRWPAAGSPLEGDDAERLLEAGAAVELTLDQERWLAAATAHLDDPYRFRLGSDRIGWWLGSVRPTGVELELGALIAAADEDRLLRATVLARSAGPMDASLHDAVLTRLRDQDPGQPWWQEVARQLVGAVDADADWELLALAGVTPAADELRAALARRGDERATVETIQRMTTRMRAGDAFTRPWFASDAPVSDERVDALEAFAESVLNGPEVALNWAVGSLREAGGLRAFAALSRLAAARPDRWWLASTRDDAGQVRATEVVLARLPRDVRAASAAFLATLRASGAA